jgi:hypothetical protein
MLKITKAQLDRICKSINEFENGNVIIPFEISKDETINIEFKTSLSLVNTSLFIDRVVSSSFTKDNEYLPEYHRLMFFATLIQMLSNIPIPEIKQIVNDKEIKVLDLAKIQDIMNETNLMEKIYGFNSCHGLENENRLYEFIRNLEIMVNEKIKIRQDEILSEKNNVSDKVINDYSQITGLILGLLGKANSMMDGLDVQKIMSVVSELNKGGEKITSDSIAKTFIKQMYPNGVVATESVNKAE